MQKTDPPLPTKVCGTCIETKTINEFAIKRNCHSTKCRKCVSEYNRKHYAENLQYYKEKAERNRERCNVCGIRALFAAVGGNMYWCNIHKPMEAVDISSALAKRKKSAPVGNRTKEWFYAFRSGKCCQSCGYANVLALDCHHVDRASKHDNVSELLGGNLEVLKAEIAKCIFLCANCHSKVTHDEMDSYRSRFVRDGSRPAIGSHCCKTKTFMLDYFSQRKCCHCGEKDLRCLICDHIDPNDKTANISDLRSDKQFEILQKELTFCQVLCTNCHRLKTHVDRNEHKFDSRNASKRKYDELVSALTETNTD